MSHDLTTISTLRRAMDEVLLGERFHPCKTFRRWKSQSTFLRKPRLASAI